MIEVNYAEIAIALIANSFWVWVLTLWYERRATHQALHATLLELREVDYMLKSQLL